MKVKCFDDLGKCNGNELFCLLVINIGVGK